MFSQSRYDVVINEIMADPSPPVGLPSVEWIEIKNRSDSPIDLHNWRIGDMSGLSGPMPAFVLQPDSIVIICASSSISGLSVYGPAIAVTSFPSLDNESELIFLRSANGLTMHAVRYDGTLYGNELKRAGGWTLEMIDAGHPCMRENNWKASVHPAGGTPGSANSVAAIVQDESLPTLLRSFSIGTSTIVLVFENPLDSLHASIASNYTADQGLIINKASPVAPTFDRVELSTTEMQPGTIYTITVNEAKNCSGNSMTSPSTTKTGIPSIPTAGEMVINEILFNPSSNGYDYVELFNNSRKIIDASRLSIANRNSSGLPASIRSLYPEPFFILPDNYIVITENAAATALNYLVKNPANILELPSLPSFPDDEGTVLLLDSQGGIVDEVHYLDDWHFALINDAEGIALERTDPSLSSLNKNNWHSAATSAGYGTPTYRNSQHIPADPGIGEIQVLPPIFSPDNDGIDDYLVIRLSLQQPGYVANIVAFDGMGRVVRYIAQNAIIGTGGSFTWDGLDMANQRLAIGPYIIVVELFNLQGKKSNFKRTVILARALK